MKISISVIFPKWYHSGSDTLYEPPCLFLTTQTSPQTLFTSLFLSSFASYIRLLFTHTCPVTEFAVASHLNTANSCCHHVFLRHFRFQKCLFVSSRLRLLQSTHMQTVTGFCRCFAFRIGKIHYHHCIVRNFQFRKFLPVYSNFYFLPWSSWIYHGSHI